MSQPSSINGRKLSPEKAFAEPTHNATRGVTQTRSNVSQPVQTKLMRSIKNMKEIERSGNFCPCWDIKEI